MKSLRFDHEVIELIKSGKKVSTLRLLDDLGLEVNDTVQFIDKVAPARPETWRVFGSAVINRIIQKRLGELTEEDGDGHGTPIGSPGELLARMKRRYGDNISLDTPVKIVHFTFTPLLPNQGTIPLPHAEGVIAYADGGSRGNPGPSASAYVLYDKQGEILMRRGMYLGVTTNNQAEYTALKMALEEARAIGAQEVTVYMDSMLVINQMKGIFKIRNRDLWPIHNSLKELCGYFKKVSFTQVPRELNKLADAEVNEILDAQRASVLSENAKA